MDQHLAPSRVLVDPQAGLHHLLQMILCLGWEISEADYPFSGEMWEQLSFCLGYAVLAPSSHNTQPWRFKLGLDEVKVYADRTRALPAVDPRDRELTISCGAALFHLRLAIRYFGHTDDVYLFPDPLDPDLLAEVRCGRARILQKEETAMFHAIQRRHTNRIPFENRMPPADLLESLRSSAAQEGGRYSFWIQSNGVNNSPVWFGMGIAPK